MACSVGTSFSTRFSVNEVFTTAAIEADVRNTFSMSALTLSAKAVDRIGCSTEVHGSSTLSVQDGVGKGISSIIKGWIEYYVILVHG